VAAASHHGSADVSFCLPRREVMPVYLTLEELILLAGFVLAILTYIETHNKKK
jgi:hypothetical protein